MPQESVACFLVRNMANLNPIENFVQGNLVGQRDGKNTAYPMRLAEEVCAVHIILSG